MPTFGFIVALILTAFEYQNVLAWWRGRTVTPPSFGSDDYTIIVPLWGDPRYFTGRSHLEEISDRVMVCCETSTARMAAYADELQNAGFIVKCVRVHGERPTPALMLKLALEDVHTSCALRLDADTIIDDQIDRAVQAFIDSRADLASVKVYVADPHGIVERLQAIEYRIAMLTRHYRAWLTSGACLIARTDALREIMRHHSMWPVAEDIETGRIAMALGMRITHVDYTVYTEPPNTCRALFRQRCLWWAGNFRHVIINLDLNLVGMPVWTVYYVLAAWLAVYYHVWSVLSLSNVVVLTPLLLLSGLLVTIIANLKVLSPWMIVFPLYAILQSALMPACGMIQYLMLVRQRRTAGRYRFSWHLPRLPWLPGRTSAAACTVVTAGGERPRQERRAERLDAHQHAQPDAFD